LVPYINFADTITCHGNKYVVGEGEGAGHYQSGWAAAQQYARNPDNQHVKTIDYRSCHSATGGKNGRDSNAQMMADATGAQVTGYQGIYSANPATCSASMVFSPQGATDAAASARRNVQGYLDILPMLPGRTI
ncbi:hypothetical protein, partial [Caballeronia sp. BR00000012568055]|uniref:hypothetical protein n=1 Tax=Caballeronia sp. BR00000012568055 TaxID=2918761 RepID=UPI0023F70184